MIFIGLTRQSSKAIVWKDVLKDINFRHNLGAGFNETELTCTLPNGSVIYVTGADAGEDEMRKLLGRKFRLACVDEASMYTINLRNLVYGVLGPAMTDPNAGGDRGTICMMGTASDFPSGLFFDVTTGKEAGWKLYQWTAHDNPHVAKQWQENLDEIRDKRPLYMETSQFRQWYLNEWVVDEDKLCYKFNPQRNLTNEIPRLAVDGWSYVLGVDLGYEDDNAFVLTAYHQNDPNLYVVRSWARSRLTFDEVERVIQGFMRDPLQSPNRIVIDGANKQGVESMRQRTNIPFEYADKMDKATFIELMNADLVQGKIKILDTSDNKPLCDEMLKLVWETEGEKIRIPKREHPALPNHRCDALLYAWRNGYHYNAAPAEKKSVIGSRQWYIEQSDGIWEREREKLIKDNNPTEWPDMGGWPSD